MPYETEPELRFGFEIAKISYSFRSQVLERMGLSGLRLKVPECIYLTERRLVDRADVSRAHAMLRGEKSGWIDAEVLNLSVSGLALEFASSQPVAIEEPVEIRLLEADGQSKTLVGTIRHVSRARRGAGFAIAGISIGSQSGQQRIRLTRVSSRDWRVRAETSMDSMSSEASTVDIEPVEILDYRNRKGERIRAILDAVGDSPGAPLVIIPPAWGRTKETLLPLARTIVETFRSAGEPVRVLRFDGIRRRGESHADVDCLEVGRECLHFTVSQAIDDICTTLEFASSDSRLKPRRVGLVTSSVAAVEGRRAILEKRGAPVDAWVSLVGVSDLQSALRVFSGGLDFGQGWINGLRFGRQELLGVLCNIDALAEDAVRNQFWFRSDAQADFATLRIPITWILGTYDAWTSRGAVQDLMSSGPTEQRRAIEIPTGHQLREGRKAAAAFELVSRELARTLIGREIVGVSPDNAELARRAELERRRLPMPGYNLERFWNDYLVGRRGDLGIELLAQTPPYQELMQAQVEEMNLRSSDRVVDLGGGVGELAVHLARCGRVAGRVVLVDFATKGLRRAQERIAGAVDKSIQPVDFLRANLDVEATAHRIPLLDESQDVALASLLISYLREPVPFLREVCRILRPGGRVVVSSVVKDADLSGIYLGALGAEGVIGATDASWSPERARSIRQDFLNDASRIIDLEEFGVFRFYDAVELQAILGEAGFSSVRAIHTFGDPAQAVVASGVR
ncbi:MAG: class I SAM-dependent methyltransferase [Myxococcota bacterium]